MSSLIRYRYNTRASETPGGEWKWRVILERFTSDGLREFEEVLAKHLVVHPPSFSTEDEMPVVGTKNHIACHGRFTLLEDGTGLIEAVEAMEAAEPTDSMEPMD